jgi:hypothetical protein
LRFRETLLLQGWVVQLIKGSGGKLVDFKKLPEIFMIITIAANLLAKFVLLLHEESVEQHF